MNGKKLDELFDAAFNEAVRDHEFVPSPETSWKKVQSRLSRRTKRRTLFKALPYVAASFILGAVIFGSPVATHAFSPLYLKLKTIQDGITTLFFGSEEGNGTKSKTNPPPDVAPQPTASAGQDVVTETTEQSYDSWEEASKHVSFQPPKISFIPDSYQLNNVLAITSGQDVKANTTVLLFSGPDNNNLSITFRAIKLGERLASGYHDDAGKLETIKINNVDAFLFLAHDGTSSIEYMDGSLYTWIVGSLSKEDIIRLAKSIK